MCHRPLRRVLSLHEQPREVAEAVREAYEAALVNLVEMDNAKAAIRQRITMTRASITERRKRLSKANAPLERMASKGTQKSTV
jgi:hypothetical protein